MNTHPRTHPPGMRNDALESYGMTSKRDWSNGACRNYQGNPESRGDQRAQVWIQNFHRRLFEYNHLSIDRESKIE